jgi:hypothetical protein
MAQQARRTQLDESPTDLPIKVGSMLFTLVEPHKGHEVAYNRWYERDHFYAGCMIGPWLFAGRRWVATRELKDLRIPHDSQVAVPTDAGSYLAMYWVLEGHHDDHFGWAGKQVQTLYKEGRGFAERTHVHTVLFTRAGVEYRDEDPVPVELALDHPYQGLITLFVDAGEGTSRDDLHARLAGGPLRELLAKSSIATAAAWHPIPREGVTSNAPMDLGSPPGGEERLLQMLFCEADPRDTWDAVVSYVAAVEGEGGQVTLAAPFIPTIPGTDTYVDQLW